MGLRPWNCILFLYGLSLTEPLTQFSVCHWRIPVTSKNIELLLQGHIGRARNKLVSLPLNECCVGFISILLGVLLLPLVMPIAGDELNLTTCPFKVLVVQVILRMCEIVLDLQHLHVSCETEESTTGFVLDIVPTIEGLVWRYVRDGGVSDCLPAVGAGVGVVGDDGAVVAGGLRADDGGVSACGDGGAGVGDGGGAGGGGVVDGAGVADGSEVGWGCGCEVAALGFGGVAAGGAESGEDVVGDAVGELAGWAAWGMALAVW